MRRGEEKERTKRMRMKKKLKLFLREGGGIRDAEEYRGLGDVCKRESIGRERGREREKNIGEWAYTTTRREIGRGRERERERENARIHITHRRERHTTLYNRDTMA